AGDDLERRRRHDPDVRRLPGRRVGPGAGRHPASDVQLHGRAAGGARLAGSLMAALVLKRIGLGLFTLWVVSVPGCAGSQLLPGGVAAPVLGRSARPGAQAALRHSLGLEQPALVRYGQWLWGFVRGDLGQSLANQQPVAELLWPRFWNTMF